MRGGLWLDWEKGAKWELQSKDPHLHPLSPLPLLQQGDNSGCGKTAWQQSKGKKGTDTKVVWNEVFSSLPPSSLPHGAGDAMTSRSEHHVETTALDVTARVQIQLVNLRIAWS